MSSHYAYVHARPDGRIFYVGKGVGRRMKEFSRTRRSEHHARVCAKYGSDNILIGSMFCSSEAEAYALETGLIKCLSRMGVVLVNQVAGGRGGVSPSAAVRGKHSVNTRQMMQHPVVGARVRAAQRASMTADECAKHASRAKALWEDPIYRAKAVAVRIGHAWNKGYKCTPEQVLNRQRAARISNTKRKYGMEWRAAYVRQYPEHVGDVT